MNGAQVAVLKEVYCKVLGSLHSTHDTIRQPSCGQRLGDVVLVRQHAAVLYS